MAEKSSWGGKRPNSGRKSGPATQKTIERAALKRALQERIAAHADILLNAQLTLARGVTCLYRIEKNAKGKDRRPKLVTNQVVIKSYLAGKYDGSDDYYFMTTERPDNHAIDSMLDRAFGKADQKLELDGNQDGLFGKLGDLTITVVDGPNQPES